MRACVMTDSGGTTDVFVGYTDRAVGAYRWDLDAHSLIPLTDRLPLNGQVSGSVPPSSTDLSVFLRNYGQKVKKNTDVKSASEGITD